MIDAALLLSHISFRASSTIRDRSLDSCRRGLGWCTISFSNDRGQLVGKTASAIEINGNRYDAVTGGVIGAAKKITRRVTDSNGDRVIDGFVKTRPEKLLSRTKPAPAKVKTEIKKSQPKPAHDIKSSAKTVHHRAERSRTLMRTMVAKPSLRIKEVGKSLSQPSIIKSSIDPARASRARIIAKNAKVSHFGRPVPKENQAPQMQTGEIVSRRAPVAAVAVPKTQALSAPLPSMMASASHQRLERILDEALMRADAHKQNLKKQSRSRIAKLFALPRWASIVIILVLLAAISFFFVWRFVPAVAVKVAATRSHVEASVPAYTPSNYSFAKAVSQPGSVSIQYNDKLNDSSNYVVTQQKSTWDSQSMAENTVSKDAQVQTSQVNGVQIIISDDKAMCVNNGIQTTVNNQKASLSSDQLLNIAKSVCANN